jgi:hypothetical protein
LAVVVRMDRTEDLVGHIEEVVVYMGQVVEGHTGMGGEPHRRYKELDCHIEGRLARLRGVDNRIDCTAYGCFFLPTFLVLMDRSQLNCIISLYYYAL